MWSFVPSGIDRKRINTPVSYQDNITYYGVTNLYPQLMGELYKRSPLTKQAVSILSEFMAGEGWTGNGDAVVNRYGQTFNDILRLCTEDLSIFNGLSMHFNFNGIGKIIEIQHTPFEFVRLGVKNKAGVTDYCKVSTNWENDSTKYKNYEGIESVTFPLYNPKLAIDQALRGGQGQVLYWTPRMFTYPLASFDAIRDAVQTDAEIQAFMLANIQNGFLSSTVFKYPGGFDSDEERRRVQDKIEELKGSYNANSIILAETPEDFTGSIIENVPANNNDRLFDATGTKIVNTILQNFSVPGPLLAVNPQGSVFTQEQIRDSYVYLNARLKNRRKMIERIFQPIAKAFGVRLGEIKESVFEIPGMNMPKLNGDPNQLQDQEQSKEDIKTDETQAKLVKLYG